VYVDPLKWKEANMLIEKYVGKPGRSGRVSREDPGVEPERRVDVVSDRLLDEREYVGAISYHDVADWTLIDMHPAFVEMTDQGILWVIPSGKFCLSPIFVKRGQREQALLILRRYGHIPGPYGVIQPVGESVLLRDLDLR
jgi:hypothetical protein